MTMNLNTKTFPEQALMLETWLRRDLPQDLRTYANQIYSILNKMLTEDFFGIGDYARSLKFDHFCLEFPKKEMHAYFLKNHTVSIKQISLRSGGNGLVDVISTGANNQHILSKQVYRHGTGVSYVSFALADKETSYLSKEIRKQVMDQIFKKLALTDKYVNTKVIDFNGNELSDFQKIESSTSPASVRFNLFYYGRGYGVEFCTDPIAERKMVYDEKARLAISYYHNPDNLEEIQRIARSTNPSINPYANKESIEI
jgi:hypothetical protein